MESSKKTKLITTAGSVGSFQGFINVHTASQVVTVNGPFIYNPGGNLGATGISFDVGVGVHVPISCTSITPASGKVLGLLP